MPRLQHYKGRHYKVEEILQVLGIIFDTVSAAELSGSEWRYPKTWKRRAVIKACRASKSESATGLGYGPDWRGTLNPSPLRPDIQKRREAYPLKAWVVEFEKTGQVPHMAMDEACSIIQRRNEMLWIAHSLRSKNVDYPEVKLIAAE